MLSAPLAYLNGRFLPAAEAALPLDDAGFVQGVTVSEQLRTFGGQLFRLTQHLDRLTHSLAIVGIDPGVSTDDLTHIAQELVAHNHALLQAGDDLGLSIFVTPGPYATLASTRGGQSSDTRASSRGPTLGLHTYPLPFALWADRYDQGQSLVITPIEQVSSRSWPPELKCRSRMHYYLADRLARQQDPQARALLLDDKRQVTETATANLLLYRAGEGLLSPPRERILAGISLAFVQELAAGLSIAYRERPIVPADVFAADEVLLTSTPSCLLPVVRLDGQRIGGGVPGDIYRQLLANWSQQVGIDIATQARQFSSPQ